MNAKATRLELLRGLLGRLGGANFQLVGSERIVGRDALEFIPSIELVTTAVPGGGHAVDVNAAVYWREFSTVAQHAVARKPLGTLRVRPWETACIVVSFRELSGETEKWAGIRVSQLEEIVCLVEEISGAYETYVQPFLTSCTTAEGLFAYLNHHPAAPGTWRMMLEFLLRKRLQGASMACAALKPMVPRTEWERRQQSWLIDNLCGQWS